MKKYSSYFNKKYNAADADAVPDNDSLPMEDNVTDSMFSEQPMQEPVSDETLGGADAPVTETVDFMPADIPDEPQTPVAPPSDFAKIQDDEPPLENEATIISKSAIINGELTVQGDVHMFGKIKGNLTAHGNLEIAGKVIGNVTGNDVELNRCELKGDVSAKGFVFMDKDSIMIGNVSSQDITLDGKVKGDVIANHKVYVRSNAIIVGNVKAAMIAIDEGAALQGQVIIANEDGKSLNIAEETQAKK